MRARSYKLTALFSCPARAIVFASFALLLVCPFYAESQQKETVCPLAEQEIKRKAIADRLDKAGLRFRTTAVTEQSRQMLKVPDHVKPTGSFTIAKTPPVVDFVIVPLEPRYFAPPIEKDGPVGLWSVWGQGTYYPPTGKFYGSVGNHIYYDANIHIVEYDPATKSIRTSPNINTLLGRKVTDFGDGKIHGSLDFYKGDNMYFCTYWCRYPQPTDAQFDSGYEGGKILCYNVRTGKLTDIDTPLKRASWPYHRLDRRRGLMFAVGALHEFICYDINKRKLIWGGFLPKGMIWHDRNMLLDEETGCVYSSNRDLSDPEVHIIKYDPAKNKFSKMNSSMPKNAATGKIDQMRAHTPRRSKEGWFLCSTAGGELFKFWPDEDRIQDLGLCWPGDPKHLYTTSIAISPDDKYVYYVPGAHGQGHNEGTPVIQLNTQTLERKVLAFLFPYFYNKYGYIASGTFSVELDEKGERLFMLFNGAFNDFDPNGGDMFGDPALFVLHIPESERS